MTLKTSKGKLMQCIDSFLKLHDRSLTKSYFADDRNFFHLSDWGAISKIVEIITRSNLVIEYVKILLSV